MIAEAIFPFRIMRSEMLSGISSRFRELSQSYRQVAHVLLTHPPLDPQAHTPKGVCLLHSLDLHVLGTPPAFVLSQDQTLHKSSHLKMQRAYKRSLYLIRFKRIILAIFDELKKHVYFFASWHLLFCSIFKEQIPSLFSGDWIIIT